METRTSRKNAGRRKGLAKVSPGEIVFIGTHPGEIAAASHRTSRVNSEIVGQITAPIYYTVVI